MQVQEKFALWSPLVQNVSSLCKRCPMEDNKVTVNVRAAYPWDGTNVSRLRKPIEDHLLSLLSAPTYVSASITHTLDGIDQQETFSSVAAWLAALELPAASYRLYLTQRGESVELTATPTTLNVGFGGADERAPSSAKIWKASPLLWA